MQRYHPAKHDVVKQKNYTYIPYSLKTPISPMYNTSHDKKKTSAFDIETHPLLIVIIYRYTWNRVLIWFQTLTSVLKTVITAATQLPLAPIPMDHSSAFVNLDSVVMDTTAQVLNTVKSMIICHFTTTKPTQLAEVESLYILTCYY